MSPDPGSDRRLDAEIVRAVLRAQFPDFAGRSIEYLGEGYDHQMYHVGPDWLFRFPKRAQVVPWFLREVEVMPAVEGAIGVPVPHFELFGRPSSIFPYPFVGYRRLPGVPAEDVDHFDHGAVARSLGKALSGLHSLDPAIVPPPPEEFESSGGARWCRVDVLDLVPNEVRARVAPYLAGEVPCPDFPGPARVVHNDILPEHVLIDPVTGRLSGIIDFADHEIGDPASDFAGLVSMGGWEFVHDVVANYTLPVDDRFLDRLGWRIRSLHLGWLIDAADKGEDLEQYRELVLQAFAETR